MLPFARYPFVLNKKIFLGIYLLAIVLLVMLPINDKGSKLNHTYLLTIRMDYICHALLFSPWMYCFRFFSRLQAAGYLHKAAWFFSGLCFSAAVELIQYFLPYRTLNVKDLVANGSGVVLGAIVMAISEKINNNSETADH